MTLLQSIFLGALQGLTEFLPVSSSGHLAIAQNLFHINAESSILFDVLLHFATLIVVFIVYWRDIWKLIVEAFRMLGDVFYNFGLWLAGRKEGRKLRYRRIVRSNYRKFVLLLIVSTIPTAIMGYLGRHLVERASQTLVVPGICLLITGVLLLIADSAEDCTKIPKDITYTEAGVIGVAQGFATLPGLSRSGSTITACLMCGFDRRFAVKYSFILSIPAILGATVLELGELGGETLGGGMALNCIAGMITAALVGYVCIKSMLVIVKNRKFKYFAYYCFAIGLIAIVGAIVI